MNARQLATVLAALRQWQASPNPKRFAFHFRECTPLTVTEIDELCQQLNSSPIDARSALTEIASLAGEIRSGAAPTWRAEAISELCAAVATRSATS